MSIDPSIPVGLALQLGSFMIASDIYTAESPSESRDRMTVAIKRLERDVEQAAGSVPSAASDLAGIFSEAAPNDCRAFLVELAIADPFAPYWFSMGKARDSARVQALRRLASRSLKLEPDDVQLIQDLWLRVARSEQGLGPTIVKAGLGGLAVAGLAIAAGPVIAPLMPAAAGLSGAAATSAGLAQLGFGSVAAGGLRMTGGLWVLGLAGGLLGSGATAGVQTAITKPGQGHLVAFELKKLVLSAQLAAEHNWFDSSIEQFDEAVDVLADAVHEQLKTEQARNDPKAQRVKELDRLHRTSLWAGEQMRRLNHDGGPS